ncbi:MAG: hypothetical protein K0S65_346 [Labilithrix sp.]|nr:hypothetical protein [Labilithrix sp.]
MKVASTLFGSLGWAVVIGGAVACGDVYADPGGRIDSIDNIEDADVAPIADASAGPNFLQAQCSTSRPRENTGCLELGATCEYGKSADRECNTLLACTSTATRNAWVPRPTDPCFESACPVDADVASLDGKPCTLGEESDAAVGGTVTDNDEAVCNMTDGICACTTGRDGATKHERMWICVHPISVCPPNRPPLGSSCSGSLWCNYGSCEFKRGMVMECINGSWLNGGATCQ